MPVYSFARDWPPKQSSNTAAETTAPLKGKTKATIFAAKDLHQCNCCRNNCTKGKSHTPASMHKQQQ
jgi:hypothetical protein